MSIPLNTVVQSDALVFLRQLDDASVDMIATDPPYNVDKAAWDSWLTNDAYIAWLDEHLREMRRVLKPNGSLYLFAAPSLATKVEVAVDVHFRVLNQVRWYKDEGWHRKTRKEDLRSYLSPWEAVIVAEQFAADEDHTLADYELNGLVYAPLKAWFRACARRAGISNQEFNTVLGFASNGGGVASGVIGDKIEFAMPTGEVYARMRAAYPGVFNRDYCDLRQQFDGLRQQFDGLRRPFNANDDALCEDAWYFSPVSGYPGKHPCEKPLDMLRHIVGVSSRPGDVVLDCFCGSGVTLRAARQLDRQYLGCDSDGYWTQRTLDSLRLPFSPRAERTSDLSGLPMFETLAEVANE